MRKRINITLDSNIYDKIKQLAEQDRRSVANKIECILEYYLARPGLDSTPYQLHYPEGVRSTNPIPETPYKITCQTTTTTDTLEKPQEEKPRPQYKRIIGGTEEDYEKYVKEQKEKQEAEARMNRRRIIGSPEPEEENKTIESTTHMRPYTSTKTADGHNKHPLVWLDENNIAPDDISEKSYNILISQYPDVSINDFVNYQHQRQNRYTPDPTDPYDVMTNNPYLKN